MTAAAPPDLPLVHRGKVRELYDLGDALLMVASDRISTYDAVHPTPVPGKGAVLTGISAFWFQQLAGITPHHALSYTDRVPADLRGRAVVVKKLEMLPIECVVRGHLTGSGWKDYLATGRVSGIELPAGLQESQYIGAPLFTPSTKATEGHDEAIDFEGAVAALGGDRELAERVRDVCVRLYQAAAELAIAKGIIIADTKFELGLDADGELVLGDEALTPDSSRYWPYDQFQVGRPQPSFDKQYVRDWATQSGWDKLPPAPEIPQEIVDGTRRRYEEAFVKLTGEPLQSWMGRTAA